jgi:glycosyltransferase involved in cell wall biosynthesis
LPPGACAPRAEIAVRQTTRVIYWCGWLDTQMVAVSKEMHQLMQAFPRSMAFGISTHYALAFHPSTRRYGVHPSLHPFVRPALRVLERRFDINHVYTGLEDWHFLSVLGRRPIVLTVTQRGTPADRGLLSRVTHVVAESDGLAETAIAAGIPRDRISVRYPGVDLTEFAAAPPPPTNGVWKCVFASSPENASEIETKGLALLIELARLEPSFSLTVLWRPFGPDSDAALSGLRSTLPPNVQINAGRVARIQDCYRDAHFSVAPFLTVGKPCPNSVIEALAVGRPALVSDYTDLGALLEREQAGVRFLPTIDDLRRAFDELRANYGRLQQGSRPCAERHFNLADVVRHYGTVYERMASGGREDGAPRA